MRKYVKPSASEIQMLLTEAITTCQEEGKNVWIPEISGFSEEHFNKYGGCATFAWFHGDS